MHPKRHLVPSLDLDSIDPTEDLELSLQVVQYICETNPVESYKVGMSLEQVAWEAGRQSLVDDLIELFLSSKRADVEDPEEDVKILRRTYS